MMILFAKKQTKLVLNSMPLILVLALALAVMNWCAGNANANDRPARAATCAAQLMAARPSFSEQATAAAIERSSAFLASLPEGEGGASTAGSESFQTVAADASPQTLSKIRRRLTSIFSIYNKQRQQQVLELAAPAAPTPETSASVVAPAEIVVADTPAETEVTQTTKLPRPAPLVAAVSFRGRDEIAAFLDGTERSLRQVDPENGWNPTERAMSYPRQVFRKFLLYSFNWALGGASCAPDVSLMASYPHGQFLFWVGGSSLLFPAIYHSLSAATADHGFRQKWAQLRQHLDEASLSRQNWFYAATTDIVGKDFAEKGLANRSAAETVSAAATSSGKDDKGNVLGAFAAILKSTDRALVKTQIAADRSLMNRFTQAIAARRGRNPTRHLNLDVILGWDQDQNTPVLTVIASQEPLL